MDYAAAYCMAAIYKLGLGVTKDPVESAKWLVRATNLGHPKADGGIGRGLLEGRWRRTISLPYTLISTAI